MQKKVLSDLWDDGMKKSVKNLIITVVVVVVFALVCVLLSMRGVENFSSKYAGVDLTSDV